MTSTIGIGPAVRRLMMAAVVIGALGWSFDAHAWMPEMEIRCSAPAPTECVFINSGHVAASGCVTLEVFGARASRLTARTCSGTLAPHSRKTVWPDFGGAKLLESCTIQSPCLVSFTDGEASVEGPQKWLAWGKWGVSALFVASLFVTIGIYQRRTRKLLANRPSYPID